MRTLFRTLLPDPLRGRIRAWLRDAPHRLEDLPADLRERLGSGEAAPLPPPSLRARVGLNSARAEFLRIGELCAIDVLNAFHAIRGPAPGALQWLDFGCGCGRVARHLLASPAVGHFTGVDVDQLQVAWAARHLPGRWQAVSPDPPLPFPLTSFDVVVSISVFTHLSEADQFAWLAELKRVLRPGGLLIASTSGPELAQHTPGGFAVSAAEVEAKGFHHVPSQRGFNHQASFHSAAYLRAQWSRFLQPRLVSPAGLAGYQDLSVWEAA